MQIECKLRSISFDYCSGKISWFILMIGFSKYFFFALFNNHRPKYLAVLKKINTCPILTQKVCNNFIIIASVPNKTGKELLIIKKNYKIVKKRCSSREHRGRYWPRPSSNINHSDIFDVYQPSVLNPVVAWW